MPSNLHPDADYREFDDDNWTDCWDCGGSGEHEDICQCSDFEDTCCCLNPMPKRCSTCKGKGGWPVDHSAEDQADFENENASN